MSISLIRWDDHRLVPWKNGLGMTREVANGHRPDGSMLWRVSLATVDRDGPFSDFTGYKRVIMMLEGEGMRLDFGGHGSALLDRPFVPVVFDGAWPTSARLTGGPTRDLNVVTAQRDAASSVEVLPVAGALDIAGRGLTLVHVLRGKVAAAAGTLETGDTLRLDGGGTSCTLRADAADALVYRIDIEFGRTGSAS
jgi:environmental stress-induced protein Ves